MSADINMAEKRSASTEPITVSLRNATEIPTALLCDQHYLSRNPLATTDSSFITTDFAGSDDRILFDSLEDGECERLRRCEADIGKRADDISGAETGEPAERREDGAHII